MAYDAAGNTTSYSDLSFTYNDRGRMSTWLSNGVTGHAVYSAQGQMLKKYWNSTGGSLLAYDEQGHLVGEYTVAGALIQETVWMGDIPVATIQPSGSSVAIYYVHSDQLNAPRKISRPSDNALMWRWDPDPYGYGYPNTNPSGQGTFQYNLRFPGQYYTGIAYDNGFREYDMNIGRYIESDPIGLFGGSYSTYGYVAGNPISGRDPLGLATVVIVGGPSGGNPFGHVSVATTGSGIYSYGTLTPYLRG